MTAPDPLGPVTIGAREIYDEVKKVVSKLDRLDGKVDGINADVADHETRIRALERGRWPLPSVAALVSLASLILAIIAFATRGG